MNKYLKIKLILKVINYLYNIDKLFFVILVLLNIINGINITASLWATKVLINGIANLGNMINLQIYKLVLIYGLVNILIYGINELSKYIMSLFNLEIQNRISNDILNKCTSLEPKDYENAETYDIIRRAQVDGSTNILVIYTKILSLLNQVISIISVIIMLLSFKIYYFLFALIIPIITFIFNLNLGSEKYKILKNRTSLNRMTMYINYLLTNDVAFKEIKINKMGTYFINLSNSILKGIKREDQYIINKKAKFNIVINILDEVIGIYIILRVLLQSKSGFIFVGDVVTYVNSISSIQNSINVFLMNLADIKNDILYINDFFYFLELKTEELIKYETIGSIEKIEFINVSFKYKENNIYALKNVNFIMKRGQRYVLIGENGSGKTTIIKLILGFYDDYEGNILINNIEIKKINKEVLREKMAVLFQDFNKYELKLRENLTFGSPWYLENDRKLIEVIKDLNLDILESLSEGLDTRLGNWFDGIDLSKGQWQKIALGRVFLKSADIYIMDEPTASIDNISSEMIYKNINEKFKMSIQILITHEYSERNMNSSNIIVIYRGEIEDIGSHEYLLENCDKYKEFFLCR